MEKSCFAGIGLKNRELFSPQSNTSENIGNTIRKSKVLFDIAGDIFEKVSESECEFCGYKKRGYFLCGFKTSGGK